jgi:cupin superfamily acireductone dioxygenase involved in methionine salvage
MKIGNPSATKKDQITEPVGIPMDLVWVQCKEFKCLAYLNETGKWINFYTGRKLTDFVKVIE